MLGLIEYHPFSSGQEAYDDCLPKCGARLQVDEDKSPTRPFNVRCSRLTPDNSDPTRGF